MNKELLYKHLDNYLSRVNLDNDFNDYQMISENLKEILYDSMLKITHLAYFE